LNARHQAQLRRPRGGPLGAQSSTQTLSDQENSDMTICAAKDHPAANFIPFWQNLFHAQAQPGPVPDSPTALGLYQGPELLRRTSLVAQCPTGHLDRLFSILSTDLLWQICWS